MKTAILTGSNGFVGKAVAKELISMGIRVFAVIRQGAKNLEGLESATVIECNLSDYATLPSKLVGCGADVFYHFAWAGTSGASRGDVRTQLANVRGACDAVRAAAQLGCRRFVFPASLMQFEVELQLKSGAYTAASIYSVAKHTADDMARITAGTEKIDYISGLISNIYGPGESSPRLINSTIRKLLRGEHISFSSGEQLYDFIYVEDAARIFAAMGVRGHPDRVYYVGNEYPRPLKIFLRELRDIVAPGVALGLGELRREVPSLTYQEFDTASASRELGVCPRTSFADGIKKTADWIIRQEET